MTFPKRALLVLGLAAPLAGCPGPVVMVMDSGVPDMTDAPVTPDVPRRDAGMSNDDFDGALPVTTDNMQVTDAIEVPLDHDFWRFEGTAGDWIAISTEANPTDDPMRIDTVITLYDSARTQIAENDDGLPRASTDSEIVIRLPSTGTYYIEVQEFSEWMSMGAPEGMASYTYGLSVAVLADGGATNIDTEAGDDAASAQTLRLGGMMGNLAFALGTFNDATDVDVYSFAVAMPQQIMSIDVMPFGPTGYGSTRAAGRAWVTDMAGTEIIARIEPSAMMQDDLSPTLLTGNYLLWVEAAGGTAGSNDHYVLKAVLGTENPRETTPDANDTVATAEALMVTDDMGTGRGFILATLSATDVDVFSFLAPAGIQMTAVCGAASSGSGLRGLRLELLGGDGTTVLGMATETATEGALITMIPVATPGMHYIRLSATGQDAMVTSSFARCGIALVPPMP